LSLELEEAERFRLHRLSREEKERITETLKKALEERSEIVVALLYGSFLRDTGFRDVDIAVYLKDTPNPLDYQLTLGMTLEKLLGLPVDAKTLNEAPPWFLRKVVEEGGLLIEKVPFIVERLYLKALAEANMPESHSPKNPIDKPQNQTPTGVGLTIAPGHAPQRAPGKDTQQSSHHPLTQPPPKGTVGAGAPRGHSYAYSRPPIPLACR